MAIKPDNWIIEQCETTGMIEPYVATQIKVDEQGNKIISYGVSSYGYDIRIANEFKIAKVNDYLLDPKEDVKTSFTDYEGEVIIIKPNNFVLARSLEYFRMPRDVLAICLGKSTYARCGIVVNVTPLEPEWEGYLTIEISNTTPRPVPIYANEGIAQLLFYQSDTACTTSYKDKQGKYQGQTGVTGSKV